MSELNEVARELLAQGRSHPPTPHSAARQRMRKGIVTSVGVSATAAAASTASKPLAGLFSSALSKVLVAGVAALVGAGLTVSAVQVVQANAPAVKARPRPAAETLAVPRVLPKPSEAAVEPVVVQDVPQQPTTPVVEKGQAVKAHAEPRAVNAPAPPPSDEATPDVPPSVSESARPASIAQPNVDLSIGDELQALHEAMAQQDAKAWESSLITLDRYDVKHPRGSLELEATALRAMALCELGRVEESRSLAATVVERAPQSPAARRVQTSCAAR